MFRLLRRQLRLWHKDFASGWGRLKTFHRTALGIVLAIAVVLAARKYWLDPMTAQVAGVKSEYEKTEPPNPLPAIDDDSEMILLQEQIIGREKSTAEIKAKMEKIAQSRPKITQQNKETVLSELATMISKHKLILLLGGVSSKTDSTNPTGKSLQNPKTTVGTKTTPPAKKPNENTSTTKQETSALSAASPPNVPPLKEEEYIYQMEGHFNNILNFLKQLETFNYPIKVTQFYLGVPETALPADRSRSDYSRSGYNRPDSGRPSEKLRLQFHLTLYFHE
jgi:hypothetical protein